MAFFLLWQCEALLRDEIQHERGENSGSLEAFNLNSQAGKLTERTSDNLILGCEAITLHVRKELGIEQEKFHKCDNIIYIYMQPQRGMGKKDEAAYY